MSDEEMPHPDELESVPEDDPLWEKECFDPFEDTDGPVRNSSDEPRADGGRVPKSRPALQHRLVVDVQAFEDGGVVSLKSEWDGRRDWIVAAAETLKDQDGLLVEVETRRVHTNSRLERVPEQRPEERDLL